MPRSAPVAALAALACCAACSALTPFGDFRLAADATPDQETAVERRDRLVHTFGNLTLLTQALNSAVSNGPYADKREEYAAHALLRLNAYFHNVAAWDEDAITTRGKALFAHAKAIWKHGA